MLAVVAWVDDAGAFQSICVNNLAECNEYYFVEIDARSIWQGFLFRLDEDEQLIDAFSMGLLKLLDTGIDLKVANEYRMDLSQCGSQSNNDDIMSHSPLRIETLAGSFIAATIGLIICFIVLMIERLGHKYGGKWKLAFNRFQRW